MRNYVTIKEFKKNIRNRAYMYECAAVDAKKKASRDRAAKIWPIYTEIYFLVKQIERIMNEDKNTKN